MASILVDGVAAFARDGVSLRSGRFLRADMLVFAVGCKNTSPPPFLAELGAGAQELIWFQSMASCQQSAADVRGVCPKHAPARAPGNTELYNYAFLGPSGRIGTASDVTYGYVPVGPKKQLDMFFHGMECYKRGHGAVRHAAPQSGFPAIFEPILWVSGHLRQTSDAVQALRAALHQTSPSFTSGEHAGSPPTAERPSTWFHSCHWWSSLNSGMEVRLYNAAVAS